MRKLVAAVIVLVVLAVAADRIGAAVAQHEVAAQLKSQMDLTDQPTVKVHGIPFLTQVIRGKYFNIEVDADGVAAGQFHDLRIAVNLRGAKAPLGGLLSGSIDKLPVDRVTGRVTITYDDLAQASGLAGLTLRRSGDAVRASAPLSVAGQQVTVSAVVTPVLVNGNAIRVTPSHVTVAGAAVPVDPQRLSFVVPLDLQFGLTASSLTVGAGGLQLRGEGHHVTLRSDMTTS